MRPPLFLVLVVLLALAGCGDRGGPPEAAATGPGWERVSDLPLSKRTDPVVVWTGTEVLALGGETGASCPPNADCQRPNESAADGAALDPTTGTWRPIAAAPMPIPASSPHAVVAGSVFIRVEDTLLRYDVEADSWRPVPRTVSPWYDLVADGDRLILVSGSDEGAVRPDLAYDVPDEKWSRLPEDPIGAAFDRGIVATDQGLLLLAHALVPNPGAGDRPSIVLAALLDRATGSWERLPDSDQLGGGHWAVLGDRVVDASVGSIDGGGPEPGDYGREVPIGGVLDLATKAWSRLPDSPRERERGWSVDAPGPRLVAAGGWFYDDAAATWTAVPRPPGGPDRPGPAAWAGDRLVVVTGTRDGQDYDQIRHLGVWTWSPAG